jgi:hypothetical protein
MDLQADLDSVCQLDAHERDAWLEAELRGHSVEGSPAVTPLEILFLKKALSSRGRQIKGCDKEAQLGETISV